MWTDGANTVGGTTGAGVFGAITNPDDMPAGGARSATYTGQSLGYVEENGSLGIVGADVLAETDFNTIDIDFRNSRVSIIGGAAGPDARLDLSGRVPVSGSAFGGQIDGAGSLDISGSVSGNFYGPSVNEVGGTFAVSSPTIEYYGAFGARN